MSLGTRQKKSFWLKTYYTHLWDKKTGRVKRAWTRGCPMVSLCLPYKDQLLKNFSRCPLEGKKIQDHCPFLKVTNHRRSQTKTLQGFFSILGAKERLRLLLDQPRESTEGNPSPLTALNTEQEHQLLSLKQKCMLHGQLLVCSSGAGLMSFNTECLFIGHK